jgi:Zn-dependent protease with chaperone function
MPALMVFCGSCMLWSLVTSGNIAIAIGLWWLTGFVLGLIRYLVRRWALKEAVLKTKKYKLFGRRVGRLSKRTKHEKASLYQLADKSAFPKYSVMTLASNQPEIYASTVARTLLDHDQFRTIVAKELGHSCVNKQYA